MTLTPNTNRQGLNGDMDFNEQTEWEALGQITVAQALLGATAKDHASVIALATGAGVLHALPNGSVAWEYRFRTDGAENNAPVLEVYRCAGADHFSHMAQLTLNQGLQREQAGIFFADAITIASEQWFDATKAILPGDNIATWVLNVYGHNQFLFIASSLVVTTIYIDGRRLS